MPVEAALFGWLTKRTGRFGINTHFGLGRSRHKERRRTRKAEKGFPGEIYRGTKYKFVVGRSELEYGLALWSITSPSSPLSGGLCLAADVYGPTSQSSGQSDILASFTDSK